MKVTKSLLESYDICGLRAQYTIDHPPWFQLVAGSKRAVGTAVHAGHEYIYSNPSTWTLPDAVEAALTMWELQKSQDQYTGLPVDRFVWDEDVPDEMTAWRLIHDLMAEYRNHVWPEDWEIVSCEHRYVMDVGDDVQLSGAIDLGLRDPKGFIVGVDLKTAAKSWSATKAKPRKNAQAPLYVALLQNAFPDAPGYRFVFDVLRYPAVQSGVQFQRLISDPEQRHIDAAISRAKSFAWTYQTVHVKAGMDLPANPGSNMCSERYCDFFPHCPFGAALDT